MLQLSYGDGMGPMIFFNSEALTGGIIAAIRFDGQVAVQNIKPLGIREAVEKKTCQNASMWKKQMVDDEVVFFRCFFDDMFYFTHVAVQSSQNSFCTRRIHRIYEYHHSSNY